MTPAVLTVTIAILASSALPQNDAPRSRDDVVTVKGCVSGNRLQLSRDDLDSVAATLRASEYALEGSKELLRGLRREHDGHYEEVTGILKLPAGTNPGDAQVRQKQLGPKTRITLGTRETAAEELLLPARLVVSSYRHIADRCAAR